MSRLVLPSFLLREVRAALLASSEETCVVLFGRAVEIDGRLVRLVVREAIYPATSEYAIRTGIAAQLRPEYVAVVAQRARRSGESIIFAHSHPYTLNSFSETDDAGERALAQFLAERTPSIRHAAMLVTADCTIARELGTDSALDVAGIGELLLFGDDPQKPAVSEQFDRQIRMFGAAGQARLAKLRVGIVGLGGTGSTVLEQLVYLGVRDFCLIDPDSVELSNLNRLVGSTLRDVGRPKVEVAAATVNRIAPQSRVTIFRESVLMASTATRLLDADFAFACTDSQGSRSVLNQLAYQYLLPTIDLGVTVVAGAQGISHIAGRTNMLAPGLGCFVCGEFLDPEAVRVDLLTEFERQTDPYIIGAREPAPAVISLNATMASMAVTMFLNAVLGLPGSARFINYNGLTGAARPASIAPHPTCVICSPQGALARGTEWPPPGRLA